MSNITYQINYTDTSYKPGVITIPANQADESTALRMHGYGSTSYGADVWANMLHLLENFCSYATEPKNPTEGQLWYRAADRQLLLRVKKSDNKYDWVNIIPGIGFDSATGDAVLQDKSLTIDKLNLVLEDYISFTKQPIKTIEKSLRVHNNYINELVNGIETSIITLVQLTDTNNTSNILVPKFYVDAKIEKELQTFKTNNTIVGDGTVTSSNVINAINQYPASQQPLLLRNGNDPITRTMGTGKSLILRDQQLSTKLDINEAISITYLDEYIKQYTFSFEALVQKITENKSTIEAYLPFIISDSVNDQNISSNLLIPETTIETPSNAAVTKSYVEDKLNINSEIPVLSSVVTCSYCKVPDGTIIVYGHGAKALSTIENSTNTSWYNATVVFPPEKIKFTNSYYSVTVTEAVDTMYYPLPQQLTGTNNDLSKVMWPLTFKVYNKTTTGFDIAVFVPSGVEPSYIESLSFNFTAIGR